MTLRSSAVALAFMLTPTVARGQGCVIVTDNPPDLRGAGITIGHMADDGQGSRPSEKPAHFKSLLVLLYERTATIPNQIGRNYLLGRTYAVWLGLNLPVTKPITTRGELNLPGDGKRPHDLYMAMDSAFSRVETENAACSDSTAKYRGFVSQMAYNDARAMLEAKKYDSAVVLAKRALVADPKGAQPWNILAEANSKRGDTAAFREALRKVSQAPGTDASTKKAKAQAFLNLAIMALNDAQKLNGDARNRLADQAQSDLQEMLKLQPGDVSAQTALTRALLVKGDSAAAKAQMATMMQSPEKYSAGTLSEMAFAQYNSGEYVNAVRLYEVMLTKNPMLADGISSYISALLKAEQYDKAVVAARKLMTIDPNGFGSASQAAATWQKVMLTTKDTTLQKAATDSVLHYVTATKESPVFVKVVEFIPSAEAASLDVQINNQTAAAKTYDLEVEFLNAAGAVVASSKASFKVDAKAAQRSVIKGTGAGIVAWRYKPLNG